MSKTARKRSKRAKRSKHQARRAAMVETPSSTRHKALVRAEVDRERMVRAMLRREREWTQLVECMAPSCLPMEIPPKWEGWHADRDERCQYDDDVMTHAWSRPPCRLDWWELAECNRRGCTRLPDSAYEARNLMAYVPTHQR